MVGEAGIGKTHLLCDVAEKCIKFNNPIMLVLGQQLQSFEDPLQAIIGDLDLSIRNDQFLKRLDALARRRKKRAIILVDAINEGDRPGWKKCVRGFLKNITKYSSLSVVLTCRSPFERVTLPVRLNIVKIIHQGFLEHEFDALEKFSVFYRLPLPELPIMSSEFRNPLFLKLFCETLKDIVVAKRHRQIKELASGQKGMTNIFEDVIISKSKKLAKSFNLPAKTFWKIVKDDISSVMASNGRDWIRYAELKLMLAKYLESKRLANRIAKAMISEGLLSEDTYYDYDQKKYFEIIRFPYQKFSDHIIARHLLDKYFDKTKVKHSLSINLDWIFANESAAYHNIGIFQENIISINKIMVDKNIIHTKNF